MLTVGIDVKTLHRNQPNVLLIGLLNEKIIKLKEKIQLFLC
jgi:hypothetical protein